MAPSKYKSWLVVTLAVVLLGSGLFAIVSGIRSLRPVTPATATPRPSRPGEQLVPTYTPQDTGHALLPAISPSPTDGSKPVATEGIRVTVAPPSQEGGAGPVGAALSSLRERVGVVVPHADVTRYDLSGLGVGWYLLGNPQVNPPNLPGVEFVQLVVTEGDTLRQGAELVREAVRSNPGSLWLVGNEPDVIWQGNATPEEYARVYHETYELLKETDPTSRVAIGGISQVTPLRLAYLEAVLDVYTAAYGSPMPVDVWNIHLAILREERGSWGVDIPPGFSEDRGMLVEIEDNADLEMLKQQVVEFRRWMNVRGLRDRPLIVTEFSVLMPPEYGFPLERVRAFMAAAFDFLLTATDESLGYKADGNRLVQRAAWYSLADDVYFTGNLFDPNTGERTALGTVLAEYTSMFGETGPQP